MKFADLPRNGSGGVIAEEVEFPVEIPLLRPVEADGTKLESVTLREPTAADIELCHRHDHDATRMVHLMAMLGDLSPDQVRALKGVDFMRAVKLVGAFL